MGRRLFALALILSLVLGPAPLPGAGASELVTVQLDGAPLPLDTPPQISEGRTLIPLRAIFEALGASVVWTPATQSIEATRGSRRVLLQVGETRATIDGQEVHMDVPARIIDGRTMVPLRFVSEALGGEVVWDAATRTVTIVSAPAQTTPPAAAPAPAPLMQPFIRLGPLRGDVTVIRGGADTALAAGAAFFALDAGAPAQVIPGELGLWLYPGDSIITGAGAFAEVQLDRGQSLRLDGGTRMAIVRHDVTPATGRQASRFQLVTGRIWANLKERLRADSRFEIETPTQIAGVRGSQFGVDEQTTFVAVGEIYVARPGDEDDAARRLTLSPGQMARSVRADQEPAPAAFAAADLPVFMQRELVKQQDVLPEQTRLIAEDVSADVRRQALEEAEQELEQYEELQRLPSAAPPTAEPADADADADDAPAASEPVTPPAAAPDDRFLVYVRDYNVWRTDLADGKETQLTRGTLARYPRVTPDDRQVIFIDLMQGGNLYAIPADGQGEPELFLAKQPEWRSISQFDLSPDGAEVVLRADPAGADVGGGLYYTQAGRVLAIDAGTTRYLSSPLAERPQWVAPDAIAFRHLDSSGQGRIAAWCFTPGAHVALDRDPDRSLSDFSVAPDGRTLIAAYGDSVWWRDTNWAYSRLSATALDQAGAGPTNLSLRATEFPPYYWDAAPVHSRDGRSLAFWSRLGADQDFTVYVWDLDGGAEPRRIAAGIDPAWGGGTAATPVFDVCAPGR